MGVLKRSLIAIVLVFSLYAVAYADTTYTVLNADLWYQTRDNIATPRQTTGASFKFTVSAAAEFTITIRATSTWVTLGYARMPLIVDGAPSTTLAFTTTGAENFSRTLAAGSHTVEVVTSVQSIASSGYTYIESVTYPAAVTFAAVAPSYTYPKIVFYGDSICTGQAATSPYTYYGHVGRLRYVYGYSAINEAWGARTLHDDVPATVASVIAAMSPSAVWLQIGTNDFGFKEYSAADFGTDYKALLDALYAALPTATIYCQSPLSRADETEKQAGYGDLDAYRAQIQTKCATIPGAVYVDGETILTTAQMPDGLHPNNTGHIAYATYIDALLQGPDLPSGVTPDGCTTLGGGGIITFGN